jgi:hypothetical protein
MRFFLVESVSLNGSLGLNRPRSLLRAVPGLPGQDQKPFVKLFKDRGRTASCPTAPSSRRWRDVRNYRTGFLRIIRFGASTLIKTISSCFGSFFSVIRGFSIRKYFRSSLNPIQV